MADASGHFVPQLPCSLHWRCSSAIFRWRSALRTAPPNRVMFSLSTKSAAPRLMHSAAASSARLRQTPR